MPFVLGESPRVFVLDYPPCVSCPLPLKTVLMRLFAAVRLVLPAFQENQQENEKHKCGRCGYGYDRDGTLAVPGGTAIGRQRRTKPIKPPGSVLQKKNGVKGEKCLLPGQCI